MADLSHRSNSLGWQLRRGQQQAGEWLEYQLNQVDIDAPALPHWPWLDPLGRALFWLAVTALVATALWMIYRAGTTYRGSWRDRSPKSWDSSPPQERLQQAQQWWTQAQTLAQQGDFAGACQALYMAGLLRLNETQAIPYQASRTDGEYLQALAAQRPYQLLIRTHERLTFGNEFATAETYQRCRRAYEEII
jgi:hypothetical protein